MSFWYQRHLKSQIVSCSWRCWRSFNPTTCVWDVVSMDYWSMRIRVYVLLDCKSRVPAAKQSDVCRSIPEALLQPRETIGLCKNSQHSDPMWWLDQNRESMKIHSAALCWSCLPFPLEALTKLPNLRRMTGSRMPPSLRWQIAGFRGGTILTIILVYIVLAFFRLAELASWSRRPRQPMQVQGFGVHGIGPSHRTGYNP